MISLIKQFQLYSLSIFVGKTVHVDILQAANLHEKRKISMKYRMFNLDLELKFHWIMDLFEANQLCFHRTNKHWKIEPEFGVCRKTTNKHCMAHFQRT